MNKRGLLRVGYLLFAIGLMLHSLPLLSQDASGLIDDFETGDFDDRWWYSSEGATFNCNFGEPGYESARSLHLTFDISADSYPGCGMDVHPGGWTSADGLNFIWRSSSPGIPVTVALGMEDPTQTNPESEGYTQFEVYLETPGNAWTSVTLPWSDFLKAEWVGDSGSNDLILQDVIVLNIEVEPPQQGEIWIDDLRLLGDSGQPSVYIDPTGDFDKFSLWTNGTQLRGANTWQRIVVPHVDGDEFLGNGHVGPPYVQEDFDRLAALGANYVNISGPGLFTETPPYVLDEGVQANLDKILTMIAQADMFAVITFRTGPGRSDFTFYDDDIEEWGDPALVIDDVWVDQNAQDAWVTMWQYAADRYGDNPVVVGYDLMCEPNAAGRLLEIWDYEEFYSGYSGSLYDWNQLYPRIIDGIREVDAETPILVAAMGWSSVQWLPALQVVDDPRVVYMVHQYEPQASYTHQEPSGQNRYPGSFDLDWDGAPDVFDRSWLDGYLTIIDDFKAENAVPVAVNEYGVARWVPDGADFMNDQMDLFEQRGMNHAFWLFSPAWPPANTENDYFDFLHGPDPNNHVNVQTSDLIEVIRGNWSRNTMRPSTVGQ